MRISVSRRWALLGALAGTLALTVATALGGELKHKSKTEAVPDDAQAHFATAKCPKGHKLTGGGAQLSDADAAAFQDAAYPLSKREWTASGLNFITFSGEDPEVTADAICLRDAKTKLRSASEEGGGGRTVAAATCPQGSKVSGGGIELDPETTIGLGSYPDGGRKWAAVGSAPPGADVSAHAVCLEDRKLKRKERTATIPASGEIAVTVKCKKSTKTTGGGLELNDVNTQGFEASYPVGKRRWTGEANGPVGTEVTAHVVCLKKQKK
jgi:hypothetical protein